MIRPRRQEAARAASSLRLLLPALVLAASVVGCKPDTEDESGPPKPVSVAFNGKIDPRVVGAWTSADGSNAMELSKEGNLLLSVSSPGHPGPPAKLEGQWLVDGERLMLQYRNKDGSEQTLGYSMKLAGNRLTLSTKLPKRDTVYTRK